MTGPAAIGLDLGGTNLKGGVVDQNHRILASRKEPLAPDRNPRSIVRQMAAMADGLLMESRLRISDIVGVGLGAPGPLNHERGRLLRLANFPGWNDVPICYWLQEALGGVSVLLENDANAAAFGEYWFGEDRTDMVLMTLGTGVGGGVILEGKLLRGHFANAGELGHMIVEIGGLPCPCGQSGCLEQYSSAAAVARRATAVVSGGAASTLTAHLATGRSISCETIAAAARDGDAVALRVWEEACRFLAVACINIQHMLNPARILLGGGMATAGEFLFDSVKRNLDDLGWNLHHDKPRIEPAVLGEMAGVAGAAELAWLGRSSNGLK